MIELPVLVVWFLNICVDNWLILGQLLITVFIIILVLISFFNICNQLNPNQGEFVWST